jgi:hypothetical protein
MNPVVSRESCDVTDQTLPCWEILLEFQDFLSSPGPDLGKTPLREGRGQARKSIIR